MGNCPACLSSVSKPLCLSKPDHHTEHVDHLTTSAASNSAHACDLAMPPIFLKPCILSTSNQLKGKLHPLKGGLTQKQLVAPAAANQKTTTCSPTLKPVKKVRFAEDVMLVDSTSSDHHQKAEYGLLNCQANEGDTGREVYQKNKTQSAGLLATPASILMEDQSSSCIEVLKQSSNTVRIKVTVTKKELRALLQTRERKNSNVDALMLESLLSPLLKDLDKTQAMNAEVASDPPVKMIDSTSVEEIRLR